MHFMGGITDLLKTIIYIVVNVFLFRKWFFAHHFATVHMKIIIKWYGNNIVLVRS